MIKHNTTLSRALLATLQSARLTTEQRRLTISRYGRLNPQVERLRGAVGGERWGVRTRKRVSVLTNRKFCSSYFNVRHFAAFRCDNFNVHHLLLFT